MTMTAKEFEIEARARITAYLDKRGFGSHEARVQDEKYVLTVLGLSEGNVPSVVFDGVQNEVKEAAAPASFDPIVVEYVAKE